VLQLRVFGTPPAMTAVADCLQRMPGSRHVIQMGDGQLGGALVTADLVDDAVDRALVLLRWRLAGRAVVALVLGLAVVCVVGGLMTGALNALDLLPKDSHINSSFLAGLSTVNISTPIVAFAAGVVGMLALETRASSAVGVAISVTTIPASAYLGVAAGLGKASDAGGALLVLGINVSMLLLAGCLTLLAQRALGRTSPVEPAAGLSRPGP
jgi:Domain of unknown function (DUF389)